MCSVVLLQISQNLVVTCVVRPRVIRRGLPFGADSFPPDSSVTGENNVS
jgi:hypothetical protein